MRKYALIITSEQGDISREMFSDIAFFTDIKEAMEAGKETALEYFAETGLLCDFWIYKLCEDLEAEALRDDSEAMRRSPYGE